MKKITESISQPHGIFLSSYSVQQMSFCLEATVSAMKPKKAKSQILHHVSESKKNSFYLVFKFSFKFIENPTSAADNYLN